MTSNYLRRYSNLPALIYLLTERKLTVLDPQSWDDSNDSHYLALYRERKSLKSVLELTRFRGHPMVGAERSVHDAEKPSAVLARVPAADH